MHPRIAERTVVETGEAGVGARQLQHTGVEFHDGHRADRAVVEDLAHREAVAAAEDQHPAVRTARHRRMHQRFVIAELGLRTDAEPPVQIQRQRSAGTFPPPPRTGSGPRAAGHHHLLDTGLHRDPRRGAVHRLPGGPFERRGQHHPRGEQREDQCVGGEQCPAGAAAQIAAEEPQHQHTPGHRVDPAGEQRPGQLPEARQQQKGKGQTADERADIVRGEEVGDRAARVLPAHPLDQRHQQRHLGADQDADGQGEADERGAGLAEPCEAGVERHRGAAADQRESGFDRAEADRRPAAQPLGEQRPDAHREDHDGQHDRRLGDGVTDQVRGQGDQFEFVDQAAGGADEDDGEDEQPARPGRHGQPHRCHGLRHPGGAGENRLWRVDHNVNAT